MKRKTRLFLYCALLVSFLLNIAANAQNFADGSGRSRMKNTVRTKNIYGVQDNSLNSSKLYGDSKGIEQNPFGSGFEFGSKDIADSNHPTRRQLINECTQYGNFGGPRYSPSLGYEQGYSSCEYLEYRDYRASKKRDEKGE